jgi:head-tail adaptor
MTTLGTFDFGGLRHAVTILHPVTDIGVSGTKTTWKPLFTTRASISAASTHSAVSNGQEVAQVQLSVTMRYTPLVLPTMRVQTQGGAVYSIQAIENVEERSTRMVLTCLGVRETN